MISNRELEMNGYTYYGVQENGVIEKSLYQKRIADRTGTKYFIDVYLYDFSNISNRPPNLKYMYMPEVTFYNDSDKQGVLRVSMHNPSTFQNVKQMELEFENIWVTMNYGYYERIVKV